MWEENKYKETYTWNKSVKDKRCLMGGIMLTAHADGFISLPDRSCLLKPCSMNTVGSLTGHHQQHRTSSSCLSCQTWPPHSYASRPPPSLTPTISHSTFSILPLPIYKMTGLGVFVQPYLLLFDILFLHRLEVSPEVHGALIFGSKQSFQHLISWNSHFPQSRFLELPSKVLHLEIQFMDLMKVGGNTSVSSIYIKRFQYVSNVCFVTIHLCCSLWLWPRSRTSPHPPYQSVRASACRFSTENSKHKYNCLVWMHKQDGSSYRDRTCYVYLFWPLVCDYHLQVFQVQTTELQWGKLISQVTDLLFLTCSILRLQLLHCTGK